MSIPNTSEKSVDLDRQENITKGNLSAKKVVLYNYDASLDQLLPGVGDIFKSAAVYTKRLDDTLTTDMIYIGEATPGTATSSATWRIKRLNVATGLTVQWADSGNYSQVWDNRESLTYS